MENQQVFINGLSKAVLSASERISCHIRKTPFIQSSTLSIKMEAEVWLKLENLQYTGSFKTRGAMNKLLSLSNVQMKNGVVAASTGNHGAAVAFGLKRLEIPGLIYVPEGTSPAKLKNMEIYNAEIRPYGNDCIDAEQKARAHAERKDMVYLSPYNDTDVVAGQGTVGVDIQTQCNKLDVLIVALGGGGLIGGTAAYLKSVWPDIHFVGCSPENSPVMIRSLEAEKILKLESKPTLSDGTAGGVETDSVTFPVCQSFIDETVLVSEKEIAEAMVFACEKLRLVVEGAAGVALAALFKMKDKVNARKVGVVICGGNVSLETLKEILCAS